MNRACERCLKREAVPNHELCRACRYYERAGRARRQSDAMRQVCVRLPEDVLNALLQEAEVNGESFAATLRSRLKAGMA